MKTAVEWLEQQIELIPFNSPEAFDFYEECMVLVKQAKEMEKEQIEEAYNVGYYMSKENSIMNCEEYYEETFK
jgi:hypothetical protein